MGGDGPPGHDAIAAAGFRRRRAVGDLFKEPEASRTHDGREQEHAGELPRIAVRSQEKTRERERHHAGGVHPQLVLGEVATPEADRHQFRDPWEPRSAGDPARDVEGEEKSEDQDQTRGGVEEASGQRHDGDQEDEGHTDRPPREDEPLVADPVHEPGGGQLGDDEQGHHPRQDAEHGGAGPERLCEQDHRSTEDRLERQGVQRGERVQRRQLPRKVFGDG